jgi:hypothetical protein
MPEVSANMMPLTLMGDERRPMQPISPVVRGFEHMEVVYAKDQPEYLPLPALHVDDGNGVLTHWKLSWRERLRIFWYGDLYLHMLTFRKPLQPISLSLKAPELMEPSQ